ncbi:MAG: DNA methyltransferase [Peptococcaceae bacterium BICA1-7]|nr:MAG: DNA methyltransferase [Peptococcaceae bacterium BICA1-7]HBV97432.1 DUF4942 domain-containing protein [Desulfotomaculum sp.]
MYINEFYPTPLKLINKMLSGIRLNEIKTILEPSAGKGDIVSALKNKYEAQRYRYSKCEIDIDVVEIDANLRHILKGQGYKVIHDDFLTLQTYKSYDLIVMNPPFSSGDKHLLKALDMQKNGGKIVCLLNAETIRNPYTNKRKDIVRRLEEFDAEVEYIDDAFANAERKTDVEIALVKVNIPKAERESMILKGLRRAESCECEKAETRTLTHGEFFKRIVAQYNFEIRAGIALIREYLAMLPLVKRSFKDGGSTPILKLEVQDAEHATMVNSYIEKVRYKYWEALFLSEEFSSMLTTKMRDQYMDRIRELKDYDFSLFNIWQIREEISRNLLKSVEKTIIALFDDFSHKWNWVNETSRNIHYYNGWKTNKAWVINKKVIIPNMCAWASWSGKLNYDYNIIQRLADIEKVFNYLDGGLTDHIDLRENLKQAEVKGQTRKISLKFFMVTFFKKGTCHIEFTNLELLKKFNLFGSQRKGWLPPSYGNVKYEDMSIEEQAVIDDFEGREEYKKVVINKDYYLYKSPDLLMIGERTGISA